MQKTLKQNPSKAVIYESESKSAARSHVQIINENLIFDFDTIKKLITRSLHRNHKVFTSGDCLLFLLYSISSIPMTPMHLLYDA